MNFLNNMKIGIRLNLILVLVMVFIINSLGIYIYNIQKRNWLNITEQQMIDQTNDIVDFVNSRYEADIAEVSAIANITKDLYLSDDYFTIDNFQKQKVEVVNQVDQSTQEITLPAMIFKGEKLYKNFKLVDLLCKQTSTTATIFQKIDDGYLRISTTVKKDNGERAVNTFIPNASPVAEAIDSGKTFVGRVFVVNGWSNAIYRPIKINGVVQGILYAGISEKKNFPVLKKFISSKSYFNTGFPFIIDKKGIAVIHPEKEGKDLSKEEFFVKIENSQNTNGSFEFESEGKTYLLYYKYFAPMDLYVAIRIDKKQLLGSVYGIRNSIFIAIFIAIIIFIFANRFISRPIAIDMNKGVEFAQQITRGNLDAQLEITERNDEIGKMFKSQKEMVNKLKEIIEKARTNAGNIFSTSTELKSTAIDLSQGANEQASATEQVSASMEEMMANIEQNSSNANLAEYIAKKAAEDIENAGIAVTSTVDAMKKIAEKISIIGVIADKTDLLAINAAIEAARAGDHGLGFGVVATEIRKLAERSQEAAKQIDELTKTSLSIAHKSGSELLAAIPDIKKTAVFVQEISAASMEQRAGAGQINNAIMQLNSVTQRNAAASEQMSASSEVLNMQAQLLNEAIAFYKMESIEKVFKKNSENLSKKLSLSNVQKDMQSQEINETEDNLLESFEKF